MGSPRAPREPATTTKGSARTATAKKTGSANVQAKRPRSKSVTKSSSKSASPPETNGDHRAPGSEADAIGAPASKRALRSQGRRTMRKLLDAAMVAFDQRGYHATRVNDVVDIAKTSHGTFYLYFSNKEDLLRALVAEAAEDSKNVYDAFSVLPAPGGTGVPQWEDVRGWVQAYSELWTRYAPLFRVWAELATVDRELGRTIRRTFSGISYALTVQIGPDSSGHGLDPNTAGLASLAMLDRFHYLREFVGRPVDDTALDTVTTMLYRALFDPNA
jgi:AcrR family transcriptional regulator